MAHFNQCIIIGNLVKDIELKSVPSGKMVTQFTLAVQRDGAGDQVDYIPCVAWEKQAETLDKYGLMEWDGKMVTIIKEAEQMDADKAAEQVLLLSLIRRQREALKSSRF